MDMETGRIYPSRDAALLAGVAASNVMQMRQSPTSRQLSRGKVGRNEPCPCGSGKKFKKCCHKV